MIATLTLLMLSAPVPEVPAGPQPEPVLVAKGKGFLVHAVLLGDEKAGKVGGLQAFQTTTVPHGVAVLHTATESGKMKALVTSTTAVRQSPPMGIDRLYYTATQVAGVTADLERLYVLVAERKKTLMLPQRIPEDGDYGAAAYTLQVYAVEDGRLLHRLPLKEGNFPKEPAPETAKPGPLAVKEGGVTCFGVTFAFKGEMLSEQRYEKK